MYLCTYKFCFLTIQLPDGSDTNGHTSFSPVVSHSSLSMFDWLPSVNSFPREGPTFDHWALVDTQPDMLKQTNNY